MEGGHHLCARAASLLKSSPNEINEDQWRVAPGPGGSLPRRTPLPGNTDGVEKSHPSSLMVTNQGREISEPVPTLAIG